MFKVSYILGANGWPNKKGEDVDISHECTRYMIDMYLGSPYWHPTNFSWNSHKNHQLF